MVKLRKSHPAGELSPDETQEDTPALKTKKNGMNGNGIAEEMTNRKRRKSDKLEESSLSPDKLMNGTSTETDDKAARKEKKRRKSDKVVDELHEDNSLITNDIDENGTAAEESEVEEQQQKVGKVKKSDKVKLKKQPKNKSKEEEVSSSNYVDKSNETPEEKLARRKEERKRRRLGLLEKSGRAVPLQSALVKRFNAIWNQEMKFVSETLQVLPEVRRPHLFDDEEDKIEEYLLEEESAQSTEKKRKKFLDKMRAMQMQGGSQPPTRALTHEELKERLHAKIAALSKPRNERKLEKKLKKIARKKEAGDETPDKKKKFISKANPNLKNQQKGQQHNPSIKDEKAVIKDESVGASPLEKTPLRKKPVVKSNGEVVYSKFDFISANSSNPASKMNGGLGDGKKSRPKAEDLLKTVQKTESKIARLETEGRKSEAVSLAETQKWDSALKRAQGEKIRDDPTLLKKTIKKQEKRKQVNKKKWVERTEHVEKLKEAKADKRKANIQARKDDKAKKVKKQQKKRGRVD